MIYKILLFVGVMFNISAHFLLKKGMQSIEKGFENGLLPIFKAVISDSYLWVSAILYAIGFIIYAIVLTRVDISKAYPISSILSIVSIFILAVIFLGEGVTFTKTLGCIFAISSIVLLLF